MGLVLTLFIIGVIGFGLFLILTPAQQNEVSKVVTGVTFEDVFVKQIDDPQTVINEASIVETRNIDDFCDAKLPNGFTDVILNFDDVQSSGMCFPIENLKIFSCSLRKLIDGSIQEVCKADIFLSDRAGIFNGIQTDSNGLGFIELQCEVGNRWADCENIRGFSFLSFLP